MSIQINSNDPDGKVNKAFLEALGLETNQGYFVRGEQIWPLPNMEECTIGDFYWYRSSHSFKAELSTGQFKAAEVDPKSQFGHPHWAHLFVYFVDRESYAGGGFAVLWTYNYQGYGKKPSEYGDALGSKEADAPCIRVFRWSKCDHDFKETGPADRRTYGHHVYTCKKCGCTHEVDSSG